MKSIISYLLLAILWLLSLLPWFVLHGLSNIIRVILFQWIGYRKKVIRGNIERSFPKLSAKEISQIERAFHAHFCDLVVESIKLFTISEKDLRKRFVVRNPEFFAPYYQNKLSLIGVTGHYNNWEMLATQLAFMSPLRGKGIYKPLSNKIIERFLLKSRTRFGIEVAPTHNTDWLFRDLSHAPMIVGFVADQSPGDPRKGIWLNFLQQETLVSYGSEKFARKYSLPIVFGAVHKVKRSHYEVEFSLVCERAEDFPQGVPTAMHTAKLEELIRKKPEFWLWTHKRWKHKRPADIAMLR